MNIYILGEYQRIRWIYLLGSNEYLQLGEYQRIRWIYFLGLNEYLQLGEYQRIRWIYLQGLNEYLQLGEYQRIRWIYFLWVEWISTTRWISKNKMNIFPRVEWLLSVIDHVVEDEKILEMISDQFFILFLYCNLYSNLIQGVISYSLYSIEV